MPTLNLTINSAPVRFRSNTILGTIDRFAEWMRTVKPECWRVDTGLDAAGNQLRLRCRQEAAVGEAEPQRRWVVADWRAGAGLTATPIFTDPEEALTQFCQWLPMAGEIWQEAPPPAPQTVVTLIFPDPDISPAEPKAEDVSAGVRWLWTLLDQHATLTNERRFTRMAITTALHHLNRDEHYDAREALAALSMDGTGFDYAALPPNIRLALEELSESMLLDDADLRTNAAALLDLVGLGSPTEAQAANAAAILGEPVV
jgi:hypothetical protein